MNFGMDGPVVTGWWVNPRTGDKFNAVDSFFEDNNLIIKTSDGRLLNYNQIQNYIQTKDPSSVPVERRENKRTNKQADETIPKAVLDELEDENSPESLLIPDDNIYGDRGPRQAPSAELGNIYRGQEQAQPAIQDLAIVDRALVGKELPSVDAHITWGNFPKREIEMLVDVMNISEDDIIRYYINNISMSTVKDMVATGIKDFIYSSLHNKTHITTAEEEFNKMVKDELNNSSPNDTPKKKKTKKVTNE